MHKRIGRVDYFIIWLILLLHTFLFDYFHLV